MEGKAAKGSTMTDTHVHIGQFRENYYTAGEVFDTVFAERNIDRLVFSSTTSCVEGVQYGTVAAEIEAAIQLYGHEKTVPLFWLNTVYIEQGINIEQVIDDLPYRGFKLHPLANHWNLENPSHYKTLRKAFDCAEQNKQPVLIHTGEGNAQSPDRFQMFFGLYPAVQFILAHSRPAETTIAMLQKYNNVYCDSSFAPEEILQKIATAGFSSRVLFGTDFPITHYFKTKFTAHDNVPAITLREQYKEDTAQLRRK